MPASPVPGGQLCGGGGSPGHCQGSGGQGSAPGTAQFTVQSHCEWILFTYCESWAIQVTSYLKIYLCFS